MKALVLHHYTIEDRESFCKDFGAAISNTIHAFMLKLQITLLHWTLCYLITHHSAFVLFWSIIDTSVPQFSAVGGMNLRQIQLPVPDIFTNKQYSAHFLLKRHYKSSNYNWMLCTVGVSWSIVNLLKVWEACNTYAVLSNILIYTLSELSIIIS